MANTMRWRYGETNPVRIPVSSGVTIEIGDLVYLDTDNVKPASEQADQGDPVDNQELFHLKFAGVAMQASPSEATKAIRVATTGIFEFDCNSATFEVGDLLGATEDVSGTKLEPQAVASASGKDWAIGRCVERISPAANKVLMNIVSSVVHGGPQEA